VRKSERAWMDAITDLGCIVGIVHKCQCIWPLERHHVTSGGRRIGHEVSLPLCYGHHRSGLNNASIVSRHPWRAEFKKRYGDDMDLFRMTRQLIEAYQ